MKSVTRGTARGMTRKQTGLTLVAATVLGTAMVSWAMPSATSVQDPIRPSAVAHDPVPADISEDDPRWDCVTMGNRSCGQDGPAWFATIPQGAGTAAAFAQHEGAWTALDSGTVDALAEGDDSPPEYAATRPWEQCVMSLGDTTWIVCPDGFVRSS